MALIVKGNGEAVVEEPKTTAGQTNNKAWGWGSWGSQQGTQQPTQQPTQQQGSEASSENASVPKNATVGTDYKSITSNLSTPYESKYDEQLADLYNQITQRKPFEYNTSDDMLYQEYMRRYTQQGQQAMRDTMGQTAALTGGYSNSYGQAVGQQAYDTYLQELNAMIPELQAAALERYNAEGDKLNQQYAMLGDLEDRNLDKFKLDYSLNADAYDRLMSEAAALGAAGDFSKYGEIFGQGTAQKMQNIFNLETLAPYIESGAYLMPGMEALLAPLMGSAGLSMGSSSGGDAWDYGGAGWNGGDYYLETGTDPNYPGQILTREELAAAGLGTR